MSFDQIDRPQKNRRHISSYMPWDVELEENLLLTLITEKAIRVPIAIFHSSPAKGRLWKRGYKVHHRVLEDKSFVGAWLDKKVP